MMTSVQVVVCVVCLVSVKPAQKNHQVSSSLRQDGRFVSVKAEGSLTLRCFYDSDDAARYHWYKLILGQRPQLISTFYKYDTNGTFYDDFNNPRFSLDTEKGKNHLKITHLSLSDSATYYCASSYLSSFEFAEGTTVSVEGSDSTIQTLVHQSASESVQSGGSVTLNCSVQTGTCDGEHSVYWFKNSEESHPGLIYSHGGRSDQCERKPNTQTHTCVFNLPLKNLNASHSGTYYCAVASCGYILFGNKTQLDVDYEVNSVVSVYLLRAALTFTTFLSVSQAFLLFIIYKRTRFKGRESNSRSVPPSTTTEGDQNEESIHYSMLRHQKTNRSRGPANDETVCVYSRVKLEN